MTKPTESAPQPARLDLYGNWALAQHATAMMQRMTGDQCGLTMFGPRYRIVRLDPTGREVKQS